MSVVPGLGVHALGGGGGGGGENKIKNKIKVHYIIPTIASTCEGTRF